MTERDLSGINPDLLIAKVRRMIEAIGLPATVQLLEAWGGTYLDLPQGRMWRKQGGVLAQLIGEPLADKFHAEFANGERRMLLPKADKLLIQLRDREICAGADAESVRDQALKYRLTTRQVQNIRKRGVKPVRSRPTAQLDMFTARRTA